MTKKDVLGVLAAVRGADGASVLASGHVQDVLLEPFEGGTYVAVVVDPQWDGAAADPSVLEAIRVKVAELDGVTKASVIARQRPKTPVRPHPAPPEGLPAGAQVLAVVSGKGGVGKSTVSVNLATALSRLGISTGLIDCDMYGFSVPSLMGLKHGAATDAETRKILPPYAHGVAVMSLDFFVPGNDPVVWRGPMLNKALRQFVSMTAWTDQKIFVMDLPPGTGDMLMDVHECFGTASMIVVTTPDPFAAAVAERAGEMVRKADHRILGIVENMAYLECEGCGNILRPWGQGGADMVSAHLGAPVLTRLPLALPAGRREDGLATPDSVLAGLYDELAADVASALHLRS